MTEKLNKQKLSAWIKKASKNETSLANTEVKMKWKNDTGHGIDRRDRVFCDLTRNQVLLAAVNHPDENLGSRNLVKQF